MIFPLLLPDSQDPTPRLATPGVGGERPGLGALSGPWPVPRSQGTRRGSAPLGCDPKSGRAEGPSSFLDSYKNIRNNFCGKWSVAGTVHENGKTYRHVARLGCKRWGCPVCGPKRALRFRHAVIQAASSNGLNRFLTLTLDPRACTAGDSISFIKSCWAKFRVYLNRLTGESVEFIWVLERQRSGYAHLHILIDRYIPQAWIQRSWQAVGGGKYVNIKQVDIHRIAPYLSKYLTKDLILADYPPGTRRYSTSRAIILFEKAKKGFWELVKNNIENLRAPGSNPFIESCKDENGLLLWFRFPIMG